MGIQRASDPGVIPWPDGVAAFPVPRYDYRLRDCGNSLEGRSVRYLGFGAEGYVYLAESSDPRFGGRLLAIKFLTFPGTNRPERVSAFLTQAPFFIHEVGSPRLARTHDLLDLRGCEGWPPVAMVMDYFQCSLQNVMDAAGEWNPRIPLSLAVNWARQIAWGLHELHEIGWVHRDIKASNIMFQLGYQTIWEGHPKT